MNHPRPTTGISRVPILLAGLLMVAPTIGRAQFFGGGQGGGTGGTAGTRQYSPNSMIGDALIEVDPETRSLIVVTDDETNLQIDEVVRSLDRPKPQVHIKVVFMEVTHRKGLDLGVEGSLDYRSGDETGTLSTLFGLGGQTTGGFATLLDDEFQITLRALAENGRLEVLARPSIVARNNQEAIITIGQEVPFIRNTRITDQGQIINTVEYEDIGIILRVTPFITSDGQVEMIVAPEISTITEETVPISDTVTAPVFAKRSAETVVVTPDGQTVVIGGLMQDRQTESVQKVPILGDIPLLGLAFRRKITEEEKTELLIFLTPQILKTPAELAESTGRETSSLQISNGAFPREDMDRYLPGMIQSPEKPRRESNRGPTPRRSLLDRSKL